MLINGKHFQDPDIVTNFPENNLQSMSFFTGNTTQRFQSEPDMINEDKRGFSVTISRAI